MKQAFPRLKAAVRPGLKVFRFFYNLRIRYKLALSYFLVTMLPVCAIGFFSYSSTFNYIKEQGVTTMSYTQQQFITNVTNRLTGYVKLADTIYFDQKIQDFLAGNYDGYYEEYDIASNYIAPVLTPLLKATGRSINVDLVRFTNTNSEIINNNYDNMDFAGVAHDDYLESGKQSYNVLNENRVRNKEWFKNLKYKRDGYVWGQVDEDGQYNNISLMKPLIRFLDSRFSNAANRQIGILKVSVRLEDVLGDEGQPAETMEDFNIVFDSDGNLLSVEKSKRDFYEGNKEQITSLLLSGTEQKSLFLQDYVFIKGSIGLTDWKVISVNSIQKINTNAKQVRRMIILYCLIALIILFFVTNLISGSFSRRILRISRGMNRFKSGDFTGEITDKNSDEIGYLASTFNEMTSRIGNLIRDNYQANIDRKEAQLKALQAQINPHFLYNSLSSISRLGNKGDAQSIDRMVRAMTTFYRMTLNKGRDIISITDEIEQVKSYVEIYKIRKGDEFSIAYDIDENISGFYTVKVILQPFIENILEHGIYNRKSSINILLRARAREEDIVFEIIDDGIGIRQKKVDALLLEDAPETKGYGIKNVSDRIKLQFGAGYGVNIYSRPGIGTCVTILIPKIKQEAIG